MIKVSIKNKQSQQITHEASFSTQGEVDAWIFQCELENAWGTPQYEKVDEETGEIIQVESTYDIIQEDISAQIQDDLDRAAKIAAGVAARKACQDVLDYIAGCNLDKQLTMQQITQMQTTFAQAEAALRASRPSLAKMAISAISPDGVMVTSAEKAQCLALLSGY